MRTELLAELVAMFFLHHEDELRPGDQLRGYRISGAVAQPRGTHFDAVPGGEHLLGGGAAQPILAADEEHAHGVVSVGAEQCYTAFPGLVMRTELLAPARCPATVVHREELNEVARDVVRRSCPGLVAAAERRPRQGQAGSDQPQLLCGDRRCGAGGARAARPQRRSQSRQSCPDISETRSRRSRLTGGGLAAVWPCGVLGAVRRPRRATRDALRRRALCMDG